MDVILTGSKIVTMRKGRKCHLFRYVISEWTMCTETYVTEIIWLKHFVVESFAIFMNQQSMYVGAMYSAVLFESH